MQQKLIHTQAELAKYKSQVKRYENDYYYGLIDTLQAENSRLTEQLINLEAVQNDYKTLFNEKNALQLTVDELQKELKAVRDKFRKEKYTWDSTCENFTKEKKKLEKTIRQLQKKDE